MSAENCSHYDPATYNHVATNQAKRVGVCYVVGFFTYDLSMSVQNCLDFILIRGCVAVVVVVLDLSMSLKGSTFLDFLQPVAII